MSPEEAAERVLQGGAWVACGDCEGAGNLNSEEYRELVRARDNLALKKFVLEKCTACDGYGTVPVADYVEACLLLGKPLPVRRISLEAAQLFYDSALNKIDLKALLIDTVRKNL